MTEVIQRTDEVCVAITMPGSVLPQAPDTVSITTYLRLLSMRDSHGVKVAVLVSEDSLSEPEPVHDPVVPNRPIPLDQVRAGSTTDVRWSAVDPQRWVIDSTRAHEATLTQRSRA